MARGGGAGELYCAASVNLRPLDWGLRPRYLCRLRDKRKSYLEKFIFHLDSCQGFSSLSRCNVDMLCRLRAGPQQGRGGLVSGAGLAARLVPYCPATRPEGLRCGERAPATAAPGGAIYRLKIRSVAQTTGSRLHRLHHWRKSVTSRDHINTHSHTHHIQQLSKLTSNL